MFNFFSGQHVLILAVIALVVVGPKDLPRLMRMAGQGAAKARALASGLRRNLEEMTRTADLDGLRAELNALKRKHPLSDLEAGLVRIDDRRSRG
jgi:sec-independent protein translocase protein TatB